jgi:TPR repeat protein
MSNFEVGLAAIERGDYGIAFNTLLPLAEAGSAHAQLIVAGLYQNGMGIEPNGLCAVHWYLKAAEQNLIENDVSGLAFHNLYSIYAKGCPGVPPDKGIARAFQAKAKSLGVVPI